jgi:hypothetical protein
VTIVFVVASDEQGKPRAHVRAVARAGRVLGDEIVVLSGLASGEQVAAAGSFMLFDGMLVAIQDGAEAPARGAQ